ncbi:MAG: transcription-repair coupling factor [Bacillota bacterium]|nr:transcription-repair coupling factor [Bacillota bacterium]
MLPLVDFCAKSEEIERLARQLLGRACLVHGAPGSVRSLVIAALHRVSKRPFLVVTASTALAERRARDLSTLLGEQVYLFPPLEVLPYEVLARSGSLLWSRAAVLTFLLRGKTGVVVAPLSALLRRLADPAWLGGLDMQLEPGMSLAPADLARRWQEAGYERVDAVETRGQFSWRGGILDVYPPGEELPLRVEFFGDDVESVRRFDPASQRSLAAQRSPASQRPVATLETGVVGPAREDLFSPEQRERARREIARDLARTVERLAARGRAAEARRLEERVGEHLARMEDGLFVGVDQYLPYLCPTAYTLLDYFPEPPVVVLDEPDRLREAAEEAEKAGREQVAQLLSQGLLLPRQVDVYLGADALQQRLAGQPRVFFSLLRGRAPAGETIVDFPGRSLPVYHGHWPSFMDDLRRWRRGGRVLVVATTSDRGRALAERLGDEGVLAPRVTPLTRVPEPGEVLVTEGDLETAFELPSLNLAVVTDAAVYGRPKRRQLPRPREGVRLELGELRPGDYVVHQSHGIGRYLGVRTLEIEGAHRDYLFVQYAGGDALYVPTEQVHLVQKYVGPEGHQPRLNRLGGTEWTRARNRVKESVRQMAQELLRLYAFRQALPGYAFSPDSPWQGEFEDSFRYEETPDQRQATEEIKRDMEKPRPMDRLLCGDVGYGKTEVAIRAAFKAVMDGKQVAVLVPTTILAQQHYYTFRERLAGYPVAVEVLSRFRSPREQDAVLERLRRGTVDIVIGTHRLLQDDVGFRDLGLLIVDEEHRFGVAHKERLKQLRLSVDVLSLTATPIPRTLHMALAGLRDMSAIETPPEDRYPVQTYVVEYSEYLVREAIERELRRRGQVFYVHNRVRTIERAAARVGRLVPGTRVAIAHGQMREEQLERVMLEFLNGEYDVLVCTSIIESGLDMPNVNTLIVEDAGELGLAQLYQLRGRVGRSNRLAYAYFTFRPDQRLTEAAERRLQALSEFTELGSGFKIAMRDLEIRGAGNLLGPEQHGFIMAVGLDMYCCLLEEAVREMQGQPVTEEAPVTLELKVDAYLPDEWISDSGQKIAAYKLLAAVRGARDAQLVREELEDRYGPMPLPARNLLAVARVKAACQRLGITSVSQIRDRVLIRLPRELPRRPRGPISYSGGRRPSLTISAQGRSPEKLLSDLEALLAQLEESPA